MNVVVKAFLKQHVRTAFDAPALLLPMRPGISTSNLTMKELSHSHQHTSIITKSREKWLCAKENILALCAGLPHGLHLERIKQDPEFFSSMKTTPDHSFLNVILPAVLSGECTDSDSGSASKKQKPLDC